MHIKRVELDHIKSHISGDYRFERGTTAITGVNGAGKTTIIEAVAWTLFDLLEYKKDDFVSRGVKAKGTVKVTFESGLDERDYTVIRDTGTGYFIYDPELKMRLAEKKDEVMFFLRQHLGVEPGTDLEALFRRAIGVPQGTFTAIFLDAATERKKAFDKLLKVEEYRQGSEKLRETLRYVDDKINSLREKIARSEGLLARAEDLVAEEKELALQTSELGKACEEIKIQISKVSEAVSGFEALEKKFNDLSVQGQGIKIAIESSIRQQQRVELDLERAKASAEKLRSLEADNRLHISALDELAKLEVQRLERDKVQAELSSLESKIAEMSAEKKAVDEGFRRALESIEAIKIWTPKIRQQSELEKRRESLLKQVASTQEVQKQIASLEETLKRMRATHTDNTKRLSEAEDRVKSGETFLQLQAREAEILASLAKKRASLERDEQFQREIKNGLCPILSAKCLNIAEGETLEGFVNSQFSDIKAEITALEAEHKELTGQLNDAREAEKFAELLTDLKKRKDEIIEEGKRLRDEQDKLKRSLKAVPELQNDIALIESQIKELGDPRAKVLAFEREASEEPGLRGKIAELERSISEFSQQKELLSGRISGFQKLDEQLRHFQSERDRTQDAHRDFLANEALAKTIGGVEKEFAELTALVAEKKKESASVEAEIAELSKDFDIDRARKERETLVSLQTQDADLSARLDLARQRQTVLQRDLENLESIREELKSEFKEKERLEKVREATQFIRETLKEAAPHVARNYVYHISNEANQMYREIAGNAENTLKWTEDYGIVLEEGGYDRPFQNLSGGEQMAAAIAVRLALLKQLSDVRIAFFDEPTTNMDAERRERLAEQISQIRHFDQLFVISHDDTFEEFVDHVVSVDGKASVAQARANHS